MDAGTLEPKKSKSSRSRRQIRGSSLLLSGQFLSKGLNFVTQILIVRYLTTADYGALGYALSIVALGQSFATFGLDRAITRFVPIYHERQEYNKLFGTLIMVLTTVVSLGLGMALLFYTFQGPIGDTWIKDQLAVELLLILIFLAPLQSIDELFVGMFAVFTGSRAVFFRKYLLGPGIKLGAVLALMLAHGNVLFLAGAQLVGAILAIVVYSIMLVRALRQQDLFTHFNWAEVNIPWREILAFTIPLLTSDLVYVVMNSMDAIMIQYFRSAVDVAALRAVQPTAKLNQIVLTSFGLLFTPAAARMFARNDREGINNLYWENAIWIAVASFPIFVLTFSLAQPITILLYGERYAQSAIILALLSFSYYFNAALGQNGLTLKVFGKVRYVVVINVIAVLVNLVANLLLIPRYGALGATIGTASTLVLHNLLKQAGLRMGTGINLFEWRYLRVYVIITVGAALLLLNQWLFEPSVYVSVGLAMLVSLVIVRLNRHLLDLEGMFPELMRLPFVKLILG